MREKVGLWRDSLKQKEGQFGQWVQNTLGRDIAQQRDYQTFFKTHF